MNIQMITATTTMSQLQKRVDMISNNIANMNTVGYKRRETTFQDVLTQNIKNQPHAQKEIGRETPYGLRVGHGAKLGQTTLRYGQGAVQETGRSLDLMIEGDTGWFRTLREWVDSEGNPITETSYTRSGAFHLQPNPNNAGQVQLVTPQGYAVLDNLDLPISFDSDFEHMEIDAQGRVLVSYQGYDQPQTFQLSLAQIHRPDLLESMGENRFRLTGDDQQLIDEGIITLIDLNELNANERPFAIRQGALEMSNVDLSHEMTELMVAQRLMQFQARSISIADDMMGIANSIRG